MVNVYTPNSKRELARLDYRMTWEDDFKEDRKSTRLNSSHQIISYAVFCLKKKNTKKKKKKNNTSHIGITRKLTIKTEAKSRHIPNCH
mgnify:CR=1 FL=1